MIKCWCFSTVNNYNYNYNYTIIRNLQYYNISVNFFLFSSAEDYFAAKMVQGRDDVLLEELNSTRPKTCHHQTRRGRRLWWPGITGKPGSITYSDIGEAWRGSMLCTRCVYGCAIVVGGWIPGGRWQGRPLILFVLLGRWFSTRDSQQKHSIDKWGTIHTISTHFPQTLSTHFLAIIYELYYFTKCFFFQFARRKEYLGGGTAQSSVFQLPVGPVAS